MNCAEAFGVAYAVAMIAFWSFVAAICVFAVTFVVVWAVCEIQNWARRSRKA